MMGCKTAAAMKVCIKVLPTWVSHKPVLACTSQRKSAQAALGTSWNPQGYFSHGWRMAAGRVGCGCLCFRFAGKIILSGFTTIGQDSAAHQLTAHAAFIIFCNG